MKTIKLMYKYRKPLYQQFHKQLSFTYSIVAPALLLALFAGEPLTNLPLFAFMLCFPIFCSLLVLPIVWHVEKNNIIEQGTVKENHQFIRSRFENIN